MRWVLVPSKQNGKNKLVKTSIKLQVTLIAIVAIALSALVHWPYFLQSFPLGDGGMFAQMIDDVRANGLRIPAFTSYNQLDIPFVYPPLPFLLGAAVSQLFSLGAEDVLRLLPALFALLSVLAMVGLAKRFFSAPWPIIVASMPFIFASPDWLWMGGGLSRSLGLLFALLCCSAVHSLFTCRDLNSWPWVALWAALAALSHPEAPYFLFITIGVFAICGGARQLLAERLWSAALVLLTTSLAISPWLLPSLRAHGFEPWRQAAQTGVLANPYYLFWALGYFKFLGPLWLSLLGAVGLLVALRERQWALGVWFIVVAIFVTRSVPTMMMVPGSILAGLALERLILPLLNTKQTARLAALILVILCLSATKQAFTQNAKLTFRYFDGSSGPSLLLAPTWRSEFAYINRNYPSHTGVWAWSSWDGDTLWFSDWVNEWLPRLAGTRGLASAQGWEWKDADRWKAAGLTYRRLLEKRPRCSDIHLLRKAQPKTSLILVPPPKHLQALRSIRVLRHCGYRVRQVR
ncbi:MAG: hypothetical protein K1X79_06670 [Oligoflexia bacterium]|nr:hypothetical protein [Oligoflexia bacterium]